MFTVEIRVGTLQVHNGGISSSPLDLDEREKKKKKSAEKLWQTWIISRKSFFLSKASKGKKSVVTTLDA